MRKFRMAGRGFFSGNVRNIMHVAPQYHSVFREVGLDVEAIFTHPDIRPWRQLKDRENCTLDVSAGPDGLPMRLHIKRYAAKRGSNPSDEEVRGLQLLEKAEIPAAPLVGWGKLIDGRSFVITANLADHAPADRLIAQGFPFERLLRPTAELASKLHRRGLHHRDLYLCHFFVKHTGDDLDLRLIDAARVARLPAMLTKKRWIIKDLSQFWYSTLKLPITDAQRKQWLEVYARDNGLDDVLPLRRSVESKSAWIAQHDEILQQKEPTRNISIPD